jgi:internalin A
MAGKGEGENLTDVDYLKVGRINLHAKKLNDISLLAKCKNLTDINLSYNHILVDISPLKNLTKLQSLQLSFNNISDLSPLAELTGLHSLNLAKNNVSDVTSLANLKKLETANLENNKIRDISVIQNLTSLETLYIGSNPIKDISSLKGLNLVKFDARGSQINNVDSLKGMKTLQSVMINGTLVPKEDADELEGILKANKK